MTPRHWIIISLLGWGVSDALATPPPASTDTPKLQARLVRMPTKGKSIADMTFKSATAPIVLRQSQAGPAVVAVLEGRFPRVGWNLVFDTHGVFTPQPGKETFRIAIPVGDEVTAVTVTAVSPKGDTEIEKFFLQVPGGRSALMALLLGGKSAGPEEDDGPRPAEWSVLGRGAQALIAYRYADAPANVADGAGSALVHAFSSEIRWRGPKAAKQKWTWSGSLNLEMIFQTIASKNFALPRFYARAFYGREFGGWRIGPFLQIQGGSSALTTINDSGVVFREGTVSRKGAAIGGVAVYRPTPTLGFSGLLLLRMDTGGTIPACTTGVAGCTATSLSAKSAMSWEAGFGLVVGLSKKLYLETRLRGLSEKISWTPATGGSTNDFVSNTYIIIDGGLGYRF